MADRPVHVHVVPVGAERRAVRTPRTGHARSVLGVKRLALLASVVMGGLAMACTQPEPARLGQGERGSGRFESIELTTGQFNEAVRDASDYQRQILEDHALTFAEYEAAVFSTIECLQEQGIRVSSIPRSGKSPAPEPELTSRGRWLYLPQLPEGTDGPAFQATVDACKHRFSAVVESLWFQQTLATQAELQAARREIAACLRTSGFAVPESPSSEELREAAYPPDGVSNGRRPPSEYLACSQPVAEEFELGASFIG